MIEKVGHVKNPLTVIAIFAALAEVSGTAILPSLNKETQITYMWFLMCFPMLLVIIFFLVLYKKHYVLYAPTDFKDDKSFLDTMYNNAHPPNDISDKPEVMHYSDDQSRMLPLMYANAVAFADAALRASVVDSKHLNQAADLLFRIFYHKNTDKVVAILLSHILRKLNKLQEAINVLSTFAKTIGDETDQDKQAKADVYYNIACYYALWFGKSKDNDLKKRSLEALRKALYFNPKIKDLVFKDVDFMPISTDKDLIELLTQ